VGLNVNTVGGDHLVAGGQKRATPGWYHIHFTQIKETDKCDAVELHGIVLAGKPDDATVVDFIDSVFNVKLKYPDASKSEDQQTRANARLTAFMIAADLVTPSQLGQPVNVDEQLAIGRHALIHLRWSQKQEGDKWIDNPPWVDLAWNDLLHIDDPDGANVPKNIAALKFVPATCRHADPKYFAFKAKPSAAAAGGGNAVGGGSHTTAGSPAAAGGVVKF
jgi:hypothetical protein